MDLVKHYSGHCSNFMEWLQALHLIAFSLRSVAIKFSSFSLSIFFFLPLVFFFLFFQFSCQPATEKEDLWGDWSMCGTEASRQALLKKSTFALILAPANASLVSTATLQARLWEALRDGAIPVLLGGDTLLLPYR